MTINLILEALVMLGAIAMGTRSGGVGVIYDVSYRNNIRPARPLSVTAVKPAFASSSRCASSA